MHLISDILEDGAEHSTTECLQTLEALIRANGSFLANDLEAGLSKVGAENIEAVNMWISRKIDDFDTSQKRGMASCAAYLYQNDIDILTNQFSDWYTTDKMFFETTVDRMLNLFQKYSIENGDIDLDDELRLVLSGLERIAREEGLDPSQAERSQLLRQATILLDDIKYHHLDADAEIINENISDYPYLKRFLSTSSSWVETLTQQNTHDLSFLLKHQIRRDEYRSWMRGFSLHSQSEDEPSPSRSRSNYTEILSYYDHCCEVLRSEDPTGDLRDRFLNRRMFHSAVTELSVFNALRREFGWTTTEIEPQEPESGKRPDAKIEIENETVWVEVTQPAQEIRLSAQGASTIPGNSDTDSPRTHITKKVEQQLSEIKQATNDVTILVLGDQFSKVEG